jgi:GalNAc-alpha-(1->4)-GalNAc-alpha-(1->3)-diNAcBac-PP-undecaprenol alpha-1,4-N-acetyl-D-galactosaminyltransferase
MRILALISGLGPGGAERTMSRLVNYLADRHEVTLMTWGGVTSFYPIVSNVTMVGTNLFAPLNGSRLIGAVRRIDAVRHQVKSFRPDVVLSFMDAMNIVALSACIGLRVPVVVSERVDPRHHDIGRFKAATRSLLYQRAHRVVVQTKRIANYFPGRLRKKISVIANPVVVPADAADPRQPGADGRFRIVAAGRLTYQKAFDGLIESFASLADRFPKWDLVIFGEGEDRPRLEDDVRNRALADRIHLPGVREDLSAEMAKSHIMAFPSRYEGFPNVLAEGLASGLPGVGYADVSGVEELIVDGCTGLLVNPPHDRAAFSDALAGLMAADDLRGTIGAQARRHVELWSADKVLSLWEDTLADAASTSSKSGVA